MAHGREVEILIHIGAPSRACDDARYRALASSYLAFRPLDVQEPGDAAPNPPTCSTTHYQEPHHVSGCPSQDNFAPGAFFPSLVSMQASWRSAIDNAGSQVNRARRQEVIIKPSVPQTPGNTVPPPAAAWQTPASIVQDSYQTLTNTTGSIATPTRVLENYLQRFENSPRTLTRPNGHKHQKGAVIPCTPGNQPPPVSSVELGHNRLPPQPPQSSPSSHIGGDTSIVHETVLYSTNPSNSQRTPDTSSAPNTAVRRAVLLQDRADSEPPRAKRLRSSGDEPTPFGLLRTTSDMGPQPATPQSATPEPTAELSSFLTAMGYTPNSLEIWPPEPPVARARTAPEDLVTVGLKALAAQLNIPERYRPAFQTRALDPFERGYWMVDCSEWAEELKTNAWLELANYIGGGSAGWGVWCRRNRDFNKLRVYCWGQVVAHVYLLLYLNSKRRVLRTEGVSWIDGEGKVIITMGIKHG